MYYIYYIIVYNTSYKNILSVTIKSFDKHSRDRNKPLCSCVS